MNLSTWARLLLGAALAAPAILAPAQARAQDLVITVPAVPPGGAAPLVNAAVMGRSAFVYFDVENSRPGTVLNQLVLESPNFGNIAGGVAPPGWTITDLADHGNRMEITFRVVTCGQAGIAAGQRGTFRVDFQPGSAQATDYSQQFKTVTPGDPCGGPTGWTVAHPFIPVKALAVSGGVAQAGGPSPFTTNVSFTVTNDATETKIVQMALPTITSATIGATGTATACTPPSLSLAAAGSGTFTCGVTLTSASPAAYYVASNASATPAPAIGTGVSVGPLQVAPATATFTLDDLLAAPSQIVRGTYQVTNRTAGAITVTPPRYSQLALAALAPAAGALDPAAVAGLAPGATATFSYAFTVTGLPDAYYTASGAAGTSAGASNVASTQQGVVSGWRATWTPPAVIGGRTPTTYDFTVSVTNGSGGQVSRIDLVNPNPSWTGMTNVSATGVTFSSVLANGLRYGAAFPGLAPNATATMSFRFAAVGGTGSYPFQILVYGPGGIAIQTFTRTVSVRSAVDFDVANLTVLSGATGNTLYWTNRSTASGTHDGVVIFRAAAGTEPRQPVDFVDYSATPDAQQVYADRYASPVSSFFDGSPGAYGYRVCNHDAAFVYSNCSSGFWNGRGYLDSAVAPAGGWTHQLGAGVYNAPGLVPGALVGVTTMAPAAASLAATSGQRSVDPFALTNAPAASTPAVPLGDGVKALFAAETDGDVSAIDLSTGRAAWTTTKAGERFIAGVTGAPASWLPAAYATEALFLGSDTGRLLSVDARTGATLWTLGPAAAPIRALATYDYSATAGRLYVPTAGAGLLAYDLAGSTRAVAPAPLAGWTNPGGNYELGCVSRDATTLACADVTGMVRLVDKGTGAVRASFASGVSSPTSLWTGAGGLVVGGGARLVRLNVSGTTISSAGTYAPAGLTLSKAQVFWGDGFVYVGASDRRLHKLALATLAELAASPALASPAIGTVLGQPVFDVTTNLFLVGASDGRLWALPKF